MDRPVSLMHNKGKNVTSWVKSTRDSTGHISVLTDEGYGCKDAYRAVRRIRPDSDCGTPFTRRLPLRFLQCSSRSNTSHDADIG